MPNLQVIDAGQNVTHCVTPDAPSPSFTFVESQQLPLDLSPSLEVIDAMADMVLSCERGCASE